MPILKSAIKKMKQDVKRTARNNVYRVRLKSRMKDVAKAAQESKVSELPELLKKAYSMIDINLKKKLIKKNNASRKKSLMARMAKGASMKKKAPEKAPEAAPVA